MNYEEMAKHWEDKIPSLAKALRNKDLQNACDDIAAYGWVLCATTFPNEKQEVLVTDGKIIRIAEWIEGSWWVVGTRENLNIIAWTYLPPIPPEFIK
jgi:hypothetical protein